MKKHSELFASLESHPECVMLLSAEGLLLNINSAGLRLLEADSPDQVENQPVHRFASEAQREALRALTAKVFQGQSTTLELQLVGLKNGRRQLELFASPIMESPGQISAVLVMAWNRSERKHFERELLSLEQAVNKANEAVFVIDEQLRFVYVNDLACSSLGYTRAELLSLSPPDINPDISHETAAAMLKDLFAGNSQGAFISRHRTRDDTFFPVEIRASIFEHDGAKFCLTMANNITARQQSEQRLAESEERLRLALECTRIGIWDWNIAEDHWFASPMYYTALGYQPDPNFGDRSAWLKRVHPDDRAYVAGKINDVLSGNFKEYTYEARLLHADGTYRWQQVRGFSIKRDDQGKVARMLGIRVDITEHKQAELRVQYLLRTLAVLSDINQMIVREKDPQAMLATACQIAVEKGRFRLAWIGLANPDTGRLKIAAYAGATESTLEQLQPMIGGERPDCPFTLHALQTGQYGVCNDITGDPQAAGWRALAGERDYQAMAALPLKDGQKVIGTFNLYAATPGFFDEEELRLLEELAMDISFALEVNRQETARLRAEQSLRLMRFCVDQASDAVFWVGRDGDLLYVNQSACRQRGYSETELLGMKIFDLDPDYQPDGWPEHWENLKRHGSLTFESRHRTKTGQVFPVEINANYISGGAHGFNFAFTRDITERKQTEQRIQRLHRTLAVLSDINQMIVREKDPQALLAAACQIAVKKGNFRRAWIGRLQPGTQTLQPVAACGGEEAEGEHGSTEIPDAAWCPEPAAQCLLAGSHAISNDLAHDPRYQPWREELLRRGYQSAGAFPLKVADQVMGVLSLYAGEPGFFDEEELHLLDELAMDISFALEVAQHEQARLTAEEELRWQTAFFAALVDSSVDGILVVNSQGRKIVQNRRLKELWKIPRQIAEDKDDAVQVAFVTQQTKTPRQFAEKIAYLYAHPDAISRDVIELVDGTVLDRASSPVRDKTGRYYGRIWIFRDMTEQRKLEEQLRQSQKMEAIGQLAGGVAHDFNNILTSIMMQAEMFNTEEHVSSELQEAFQQIREDSKRAANLTRQLLQFSRRQVMQPRVVDLNEIVTHLAKMLQRIIGEDVRMQLHLHPTPLLTYADAGMLDQVLMNLTVNARDAMPEGGQLIIETGEKDFTPEESAAFPDTKPGRHVCLRVTDTGDGIAPENLPHIFEPFFTTKGPGRGTGLGLATVFGIVKQHHGRVAVESTVGKGTTFLVFLPVNETAPQDGARENEKPKPRGGTETILLAEDERAVRRLIRITLERAGYQVLEAANGVEAMRLEAQHSGPIHLLFTDIVMPEGISGRELASRMQARNPRLKVIFTSGYSPDIAGQELSPQEAQHFIQKPCLSSQLLETVRQCLDT